MQQLGHTYSYAGGATVDIYYFRPFYEAKTIPSLTQNSCYATENKRL